MFFHFSLSLLLLLHFDCLIYYFSFRRLNSFSINFNFIEKEKTIKWIFRTKKRVSTFTRGVITRMSANDGLDGDLNIKLYTSRKKKTVFGQQSKILCAHFLYKKINFFTQQHPTQRKWHEMKSLIW